MKILARLLIKALSLLYFFMFVIGMLGYFQIEEYSTSIFALFHSLLGSYAIVIPIVCLVFTVICWMIASSGQKEQLVEDSGIEDHEPKRPRRDSAQRKNPRSREAYAQAWAQPMPSNGFPSYFSGRLSVKEEGARQNKLENLGTNFSTYFGEGKKNIYLPAKPVNVDGFREYFRDRKNLQNVYEQAVNDIPISELIPAEDHTIYRRQAAAAVMNSPVIEAGHEKEIVHKKSVQVNTQQVQPQTENRLPDHKPQEQKKVRWRLPDTTLLSPIRKEEGRNESTNPRIIEEVLRNFGVNAKVVNITVGPVLTRYELTPAPGTKISKIVNLADDIALALASREIRIEAPIPGKAAVGIEIPRKYPRTVYFREIIDSDQYRQNQGKLKVALGKDIADTPTVGLLDKMPHLLVAGATGSGKSIFINCLVNSILYNATPDEIRLLLIDPKMVELNVYNGIPHLLTPVVTDPKKANIYLKYIVREMEIRYELFAANGVRDIEHYNKATTTAKLPFIVVIIDELADLMMVASHEVEECICRLAQMARAAGIHLVIATQRPSVNVITGLIKANIPSRISFAVSSQIDSRTILDGSGAEKLLGKGDMLYSPIGLGKPVRVHGCYIDEQEVKNVIEHWKSQGSPVYGIDDTQLGDFTANEKNVQEDYDDRFAEAGELVISTGITSVSFLQRRLRVGYSRAARLMDMLEEAGVVSRNDGNKSRDILMSLEAFQSQHG